MVIRRYQVALSLGGVVLLGLLAGGCVATNSPWGGAGPWMEEGDDRTPGDRDGWRSRDRRDRRDRADYRGRHRRDNDQYEEEGRYGRKYGEIRQWRDQDVDEPQMDGTEALSTSQIEASMLSSHNRERSEVGVAGISWSDDLAGYATEWAEYLAAEGCDLIHRREAGRRERKVGENLYMASPIMSSGPPERQSISPDDVVSSWAEEKDYYDPRTNSCDPGMVCGHYTQIVWRDSKFVGCGMAFCSDQGQIWVCNYDPPGNYMSRRPY